MTASSLRVVNFSTIVFFLSLSLLWGGRNVFGSLREIFFLNFSFFLRLCNSFRKRPWTKPTHTLSPLSLCALCSPDLKDLRRVWLTHVSGCLPCDIITSSSCCLPRKRERRYFWDDNNSEKTFLSAWLTRGKRRKTQIGGSWAHDSVTFVREYKKSKEKKNSLNLR